MHICEKFNTHILQTDPSTYTWHMDVVFLLAAAADDIIVGVLVLFSVCMWKFDVICAVSFDEMTYKQMCLTFG